MKHRTWRKIHLAISLNGEVRVAELTSSSKADCKVADKKNQRAFYLFNFRFIILFFIGHFYLK